MRFALTLRASLPLMAWVALFLLPAAVLAAPDSYYTFLSRELTAQGLPAVDPVTGETEEEALSAFTLTYLSGFASQEMVAYKNLPFTQALKLQSSSAPDQNWHHCIQRSSGGRFMPGDVGLLAFAIRVDSAAAAPVVASLKGADDPYPVILNANVTPTKSWQTVYLPFQSPADFAQAKTNLALFFGGARQTVEIGGVALYDYGFRVTLAKLQKAVAGLPISIAGVGTVQQSQFPFGTPWNDASQTFLDVSFLNDGPAGSHGFIVAKNGHFAESGTGKRIRFLGTNFAFAECFPTHEAADGVTAHLAKYGINVVRIHHQDNTYGDPNTTLWDAKFPDHRHLDPAKLERLDYLIAALKKHGIYTDMCLHVSRRFIPADGFPASVSKIGNLDKRVDEFDKQMITVDQEYFRGLMAHRNPYTHLRYADDPAFLSVEINNENSLMSFNVTPGSGLSGLPEPYGGELRTLWNTWLAKKYGATTRLANAWKSAGQTHGPNLYPWTPDPGRWKLEAQPGTAATLTQAAAAVRVDVTKIDDIDWHVQLYRNNMGVVENGKTYTITLEAKADRERDQSIGANLQHPNYGSIGLNGGMHLTTQWQPFSLTFVVSGAEAGQNRLPALTLGGQTGTIWLKNIAVKEGTGAFALPSDQILEAKSVVVEPSGQGKPRRDWVAFLAETEDGYNTEMRRFLRNVVGVKQMITLSQVSFGGLYGAYRESKSDFVDAHSYWDYADWFNQPVTNKPMTPAFGKGDALTGGLGQWRVAGKPFTVTEYNIPFPNEFRAEAVPTYASFAAFQDWDAIYLFSHSDYGAGGATGYISFPLEEGVDPAVFGFLPSAALMFRAATVPSAAAEATLALPAEFPAARVAAGLDVASAWEAQGFHSLDTMTRRVGLGLGLPKTTRTSSLSAVPPLRVSNADPQTATYVLDSPQAKAVTGYLGGQTISFGGVQIAFGHLTNRFGALTLVAMDQKPLAHSVRALLTFVTHTQNTGQQWNTARTLLTQTGSGPVLVDVASAQVFLAVDGPRTVYALDSTGALGETIKSAYSDGMLTFSVTPDQKTIWYAVVKP